MTVLSKSAQSIRGTINVPGDKSISHRAIMLTSLAEGTSFISGLLESEDVLATLRAFQSMGVRIEKQTDGRYKVEGVGLNGLKKPKQALDMGNAGTAMRLMAGILCAQNFDTILIGDESLSRRPMGRIIDPLKRQNAIIKSQKNGFPPLEIYGNKPISGGVFSPEVASAQVKSAILLAGLWSKNTTTVFEAIPTRDYTEKMLQDLGANVMVCNDPQKSYGVKLYPGKTLKSTDINIAGDISSAAFPMVAAAIIPGSDLTIKNIGLHPTRNGIIRSLKEMGADIHIHQSLDDPSIGDIHIRSHPLKGAFIPASWAASQIDEYPALFIAAACATGETVMEGIGELRVKESDRLSVMAWGLRACGVDLTEGDDWIKIRGNGTQIGGKGKIQTHLDHRIAMAFIIAGMTAKDTVEIDDIGPVETSFPNFVELMNGIGADIV